MVGVLTLPTALSSTRDVLWALTAAGTAVLCLGMVGYLTPAGQPQEEIAELQKDLKI